MIDLTKFCGADPDRTYLHEPFSSGDFSYATNGHIFVRVPRHPSIPQNPFLPETFHPDSPLADLADAIFEFPPSFNLPKVTEAGDCKHCDGHGRAHDCPDCECMCEWCEGTGQQIAERRVSTTLGGVPYALRYVRMLMALPGVRISAPDVGKALLFRFDGGVGALMPLRHQYETHVDILPAQTPDTMAAGSTSQDEKVR